jgi:uncharacterized phage infection (PIP) family protein YhgE
MDATFGITAQPSSALITTPSSSEKTGAGSASSSVQATETSNAVQNASPVRSPDQAASKQFASVEVTANFVSLQAQKEQGNQVAQTVRQLDTVLENVDKMRSNLTQIVKMYPPYPHDSSERAKILSEVSGLRQLTEQLTIPPPYDVLVKQGTSAPPLGHINASDAEVAKSLDNLNGLSSAISTGIKQLYPQGGDQGSVGAEILAQQQSQSVSTVLSSVPTGVSGEAGRVLASSLAG